MGNPYPRARMQRTLVDIVAVALLITASVHAQKPAPSEADPDPQPGQPQWDSLASPRQTMFTFLEEMGALKQNPGDAAALQRMTKCLDLTRVPDSDPLLLGIQLLEVLDKLGTIKPEDLPDQSYVTKKALSRFVHFPRHGHLWVWEELKPFGKWPVGEIVLALTRGERWQFSASTMGEIGQLVESMEPLPPRHLEGQIKSGRFMGLVGPTFSLTQWWGWAALLLCIFASLVAGKMVQAGLRRTSQRLTARGWETRATVFQDAANPVGVALLTLGLMVGLEFIHLETGLHDFRMKMLKFLYLLAAAWFVYNLIDVIDAALRHLAEKTESPLDDMVVPLVRKTLRIFLVIIFSIVVLQNVFELNITGFLASLGIAGLAVSLAAQDSVKNLFGSITIFFDKPFIVGDFIKFGGHMGKVEEIGFRSTRIRLLSGHLVTVPNMNFTASDVENITARPYIRRQMDVTITYDTPPEKIDQAVKILGDVLNDPQIIEEGKFDLEDTPPRIAFNELNADSLNIRAYYWYQIASDPDRGFFTFLEHCQLVNTKLFKAYAEAGIDFAFPTQTLYLAGDPSRRLDVEVGGGGSGHGTKAYT